MHENNNEGNKKFMVLHSILTFAILLLLVFLDSIFGGLLWAIWSIDTMGKPLLLFILFILFMILNSFVRWAFNTDNED
tara:strand:- start:1532 stop:1765 length:234 start_codon:yes stop_codon:yes gene_type:complete